MKLLAEQCGFLFLSQLGVLLYYECQYNLGTFLFGIGWLMAVAFSHEVRTIMEEIKVSGCNKFRFYRLKKGVKN